MIDFSNKTQKNIQKEMLSQVSDELDKRQGSIIQTALGPSAWYLEGMYLDLAKIQENSRAKTAQGDALDLIVIERGISRTGAVAAVRKGTFNVKVPSGALFKTINGPDSVVFIVGDLIDSETDYTYALTCAIPGVIGNAYTGNLLPVTAVSGLTSATIGAVIRAGAKEETDEALRERYMATFEAPAFYGNISAYRQKILAIEGVRAVQIYPAWSGGGTALCSILGDDLKPVLPAVVETVQNLICPPEEGETEPSPSGYGFAPIGASVTITTGTELVLNITCDIEFASTIQNGEELYQSEIEQKIQEYLDEVCLDWGKPLKKHSVSYPVSVYISRIVYSILGIADIVNVTNVKINGSGADLHLTENSSLQQVPILGTVIING